MSIGRRSFLGALLRAGGAAALGPRGLLAAAATGAPAIVRRDGARPSIAEGVASGDVTLGRGIVWSRTDRPARMQVEWSTTESFRDVRRVPPEHATEAAGFTARVDLARLPAGQRIFYRVRFEDASDPRARSPWAAGSFASPPDAPRDVTFAWSADTCGQGWGIDPRRGGLMSYETMRRAQPDFFVHCGDTVYADDPLPAERALQDGTVWRNLVTPAKAKVAETLEEFRGNHLYNLLDENVRRFNAEVSQVAIWDDHEVLNNWYPGKSLEGDARYSEKSVETLARRARQAFLEHVPIRVPPGARPPMLRVLHHGPLLDVFALDLRSERGPNTRNRQSVAGGPATLLGPQQSRRLRAALAASTATWKVVASSIPIGSIVCDGDDFEGIANGPGEPLGRELEIASLLRFVHERRIRNVVWVTADIHYAAAHHYAPERARLVGFDPFWEFVAGPLHAGVGIRLPLDPTFGPEVRFCGVPPNLDYGAGPPSGLQFFGTVAIAAEGTMTVRLHDLSGLTLWSVDLEPERRSPSE